MPKSAALKAVIKAYHEQVAWLLVQSREHGTQQPGLATSFLERARELNAVMEHYEKQSAKLP